MRAILDDVPKRKLWCGPAALAATTGLPTSRVLEATDRSTRANSGRLTGGMSALEMARATAALGFRWVPVPEAIRPPTRTFVNVVRKSRRAAMWGFYPGEATQRRTSGGTKVREFLAYALRTCGRYIITVPGHYLAVEGLLFQDNSYRTPTWALEKAKLLRRRVVSAYRIEAAR